MGGIATNLQGYQCYTGDVDIYDETSDNRLRLRQAYKTYCGLDFSSFETIQFVPGWVNFSLTNGDNLDIMTSMVGVEASFDECLQMARSVEIKGVFIPVIHINHLIPIKKPLPGRRTNWMSFTSKKLSNSANTIQICKAQLA